MKIAIISDIHSNMEALEAVDDVMSDLGVEQIYFAGDVVGYGPDPALCADWVQGRADLSVMGNHDSAALGLMDTESFNPNAKKAITWNAEQLGQQARDFLTSLPMTMERDGITVVHANPREPEGWNYIFSLWDAEINFEHFNGNFCFVGHSHQPVAVGMDPDGQVSVQPGESFKVTEGARYLVNVGSVGQPRDGNPAACFGVLDMDENLFTFVRVPYDFKITQKKMLEAGLPEPLAERLAEGR
jgi:predicted phosphodiesterase